MSAWLAPLWYETVYLITHLGCTLTFSLRTEGRNNVPATGPVLLVANHGSFLDPILIGLSTRRHLSYLARKTLFRSLLFRGLIRSLNAVPIDQEGVGKEGLKTILEQLRAGRAVVVFPEGTRTEDGNMGPFKPGVNLLISRANSHIVPVGIAGAYEAWPVWRPYPIPAPLFLPARPGTIAVSVGQPIRSEQYAGAPREEVLADLFGRVRALKDRAEHLRRKG
jgi:1-acyl-sn-glycerol-3-phosphate acyltransferase